MLKIKYPQKFENSQLILTEKEKMPAIEHFDNVNLNLIKKSLFGNKNEEKVKVKK